MIIKNIKITDKNADKLEAAFNAVNGKATAHTTTGGYAFGIANEAEKELEEYGLPKSKRKGATVVFTPQGPAKAYKYKATTTTFTITRDSKGWSLVSVERCEVYPGYKGEMKISVSQDQADIIAKTALKGLTVQAAA